MRQFLKGLSTALAKITGGSIDGTPIGSIAPSLGTFTTGNFVDAVVKNGFVVGNGLTSTSKQLSFSYDTTNNVAAIQSIYQGTAATPLNLNPSGGAVTAPTPATADNSTSVATTAWYRAQSRAPTTTLVSASANATLTAAQNGALVMVTGSITLTLPAVSGASATAPLFYNFEKRDGGATVATIATSGTDTIVGGLSSAKLYQEEAALISFGGPWNWLERQRGWVPLIAPVILTTQTLASLSITTGFGDPEIAEAEIDLSNLVTSVSTTVLTAVIKNGNVLNNNTYTVESLVTSNTAMSATSASTTAAGVGLVSTSGKVPIDALIRCLNTLSAAPIDQRIKFNAMQVGATRQGTFYETTVAQLGGLALTPNSGTITSISYTLKGFRP